MKSIHDILTFCRNQDAQQGQVYEFIRKKGIALNKNEKWAFHKSTTGFFGTIFSHKCVSSDEMKIQDIKRADQTKDPKEIRSLLGVAKDCIELSYEI